MSAHFAPAKCSGASADPCGRQVSGQPLRKRCSMSQVPDHQPEEKQEGEQHIPLRQKQPMVLLQRYKHSTLKTKISLWSVFTLVILLLALGVSLLTVNWPFPVPFRNAGVTITANPVYFVSP